MFVGVRQVRIDQTSNSSHTLSQAVFTLCREDERRMLMQGTGCCDGAACSCTERGPTAVSGSLSRAETRKAQRVQITLTSLRLTISLSGNFNCCYISIDAKWQGQDQQRRRTRLQSQQQQRLPRLVSPAQRIPPRSLSCPRKPLPIRESSLYPIPDMRALRDI